MSTLGWHHLQKLLQMKKRIYFQSGKWHFLKMHVKIWPSGKLELRSLITEMDPLSLFLCLILKLPRSLEIIWLTFTVYWESVFHQQFDPCLQHLVPFPTTRVFKGLFVHMVLGAYSSLVVLVLRAQLLLATKVKQDIFCNIPPQSYFWHKRSKPERCWSKLSENKTWNPMLSESLNALWRHRV